MSNKDKGIINDGVVFLEPKSFCSVQDILDIALSPIIAVKVEESEEVLNFLEIENGVFGDDVFGENDLSLFIGDFLFVHEAHMFIYNFCRYGFSKYNFNFL